MSYNSLSLLYWNVVEHCHHVSKNVCEVKLAFLINAVCKVALSSCQATCDLHRDMLFVHLQVLDRAIQLQLDGIKGQ